ncbi:MAG TPA: hypothetical protein VIF11_07100 [Methylomirabilota bacterium]
MRRMTRLLLVLALVGSSTPSWASSEATAVEIGSSAGSAFGTLIYAPFKATFCILGGIGSGFTAIASPPAAGKVAMAACGGSWIVTPNVIRGRESLKFIGDPAPATRSAAAR